MTRRVSLHDGDARPIAKGRLGKPAEFGHKAQVTDNDNGVIVDHTIEMGNPADAPQLAPAVARVTKRVGRAPATVTADRGYGGKRVEDDLYDLGVRTVVIPRKGKPGQARQADEHRRAFRRPSSGAPEVKDASAPSSVATAGIAPASTAPKEPESGLGTAASAAPAATASASPAPPGRLANLPPAPPVAAEVRAASNHETRLWPTHQRLVWFSRWSSAGAARRRSSRQIFRPIAIVLLTKGQLSRTLTCAEEVTFPLRLGS
jgi:hypothetical protein